MLFSDQSAKPKDSASLLVPVLLFFLFPALGRFARALLQFAFGGFRGLLGVLRHFMRGFANLERR